MSHDAEQLVISSVPIHRLVTNEIHEKQMEEHPGKDA